MKHFKKKEKIKKRPTKKLSTTRYVMKMAHIILIILDINDLSGLFNNSAGRNFLDKAEVTIVNDASPDIHCE